MRYADRDDYDVYDLLRIEREFTRVSPTLYLGGAPVSSDIPKLEACGVKFFLNVAKEIHDDCVTYGSDILSVHIPLRDHTANPAWLFEEALLTLRQMEKRGIVLVHCGIGVSRSPTTIALYWYAMGREPSVQSGIERLKGFRRCVSPSELLLTNEVMDVANKLKKRWVRSKKQSDVLV